MIIKLELFGASKDFSKNDFIEFNFTEKSSIKDLILKQLNYKKESHYLELGETCLTKNLSTTGG